VISALRLNKPILAGWSYGGFIICDYIRHYGQENLGGLIFVAAATEMGRDEANTLYGAEFLQLVPGFFSTDYATFSPRTTPQAALPCSSSWEWQRMKSLMHCGHVPFVEAAKQFNQDVAAFMQRVHG
jgi:pimeloyl-ACP methyl ester carboxylesterase